MLDPSYLRSIRDGIITGNIEANNNEAMPDGLVGLYDQELFPPTMKWKERKETLYFFLVFALAQKEISADFAARILSDERYNYSEEDSSKEEKRLQRVNELIQRHSKRFSSAGSGKYRLYHERFRLYVLQKVTEQDITQFNAKFIAFCDTALESTSEKDISEKESYALEFISTHYFIGAMQGETECLNKEHATALKQYAYDHRFWERQVKASKGFEWSKHMLNHMMSWASKFNEDDEVIECALNKVDLYHQEQNDAPRIVQLVADGDIETALERIEKFGGEDKEGLQRKFILYMLCLMELTLMDSKDKNHAKTGIEKILKHLSDNLKLDYYELNLNHFTSPYLLFLLSFELSMLGVASPDFNSLLTEWDFDWATTNRQFGEKQIQFIGKLIDSIVDVKHKDSAQIKYAKLLLFQGESEKAMFVVSSIHNKIQKAKAMAELSTGLWQLNKEVEVKALLKSVDQLLKECVDEDSENEMKSSLAIEMSKQLKFDEAIKLTGIDIRECETGITFRGLKCYTLLSIAAQLVENGYVDRALEIADLIGEISPLIVPLAKYYSQNGQLQQAFDLEEKYDLDEDENEMIMATVIDTIENKKIDNSIELCTSGSYEEALCLIEEITCEKNVFYGYKRFAETLHSIGYFDESRSAIQKAIDCLQWGVFDYRKKLSLRIELIVFLKNTRHDRFLEQFQSAVMSLNKLVSLGLLNEALELISRLPDELHGEFTRELIFSAFQQNDDELLLKNCKLWLAEKYPNETTIQLLLNTKVEMQIEDIISFFDTICEKIVIENQTGVIDFLLEKITDKELRNPINSRIARQFFQNENYPCYLNYLNKINDNQIRIGIQKEIITKLQSTSSIRFYISELDRFLDNAEVRNDRFIELFECLSDLGYAEELYIVSSLVLKNIELLMGMTNKVSTLIKLSDILMMYGFKNEASDCYNKSLYLAQNNDDFEQDKLLNQVALKVARNGDVDFARKLLDQVVLFDPYERLDILYQIALVLINNSSFNEAYELVDEVEFPRFAREKFFSKIANYLIQKNEFDELNKLLSKFSEYPFEIMIKKAVHLFNSGYFEEGMALVFNTEDLDESYVSEFLIGIFDKTNIEEIIQLTREMNDSYWRNVTLKEISILLFQRGIFTTAIELMNEISYVQMLNSALKKLLNQIESNDKLIPLELLKIFLQKSAPWVDFNLLIEIVELALKINDKEIITILSNSQDSINFKEKYFYMVGQMIYQGNEFKLLSDNIFMENKKYFIHLGFLENASVDLFSRTETIQKIKLLNRNEKLNRIILYKYSLTNLFAGHKIPERFNRSLNLQWAIDIKNQLPN